MNSFITTLRQALLALALAATSMAAQAGVIPSYHVTINTAVAGNTPGLLDFHFGGLGGPAAVATISNLQGAITAIDGFSYGDWQEVVPFNSYTLLNTDSYLSFQADFGGSFSFDLAFTGEFLDNASDIVSMFTVFALDGVTFAPIGGQDFAAQFALFPATAQAGPSVGVDVDGRIAQVQNVPEPSALLMLLTGLAIIGAITRRRAA
jgi:hypothetical protein